MSACSDLQISSLKGRMTSLWIVLVLMLALSTDESFFCSAGTSDPESRERKLDASCLSESTAYMATCISYGEQNQGGQKKNHLSYLQARFPVLRPTMKSAFNNTTTKIETNSGFTLPTLPSSRSARPPAYSALIRPATHVPTRAGSVECWHAPPPQVFARRTTGARLLREAPAVILLPGQL